MTPMDFSLENEALIEKNLITRISLCLLCSNTNKMNFRNRPAIYSDLSNTSGVLNKHMEVCKFFSLVHKIARFWGFFGQFLPPNK